MATWTRGSHRNAPRAALLAERHAAGRVDRMSLTENPNEAVADFGGGAAEMELSTGFQLRRWRPRVTCLILGAQSLLRFPCRGHQSKTSGIRQLEVRFLDTYPEFQGLELT